MKDSALQASEEFHAFPTHMEIWRLFCSPLVSGTHLLVSPEEYRNIDGFLRAPGIWLSLVRCLPRLRSARNLNRLGDGSGTRLGPTVDTRSQSMELWNLHVFHVKVDLGSRGRFRRAVATRKSGHFFNVPCIWQSLRQSMEAVGRFPHIFYVKVYVDPG